MKKIMLFCLAVVLSLMCCSCSLTQHDNPQDEQSTTHETESRTETREPIGGALVGSPNDSSLEKSYLPAEVSQQMSQYYTNRFSEFSPYKTDSAPYAIQDVFGLSNIRLTSITIPVYRVGEADENGNYVFSLHIVSNSYEGLKKPILKTYKVLIDGAEHGINNNSIVGKLIKVDLSGSDIVLKENETLAYYDPSDTVVPAYITEAASSARKYLSEKCPWAVGFFSKVGTASLEFNALALFYDFEYEIQKQSQEDFVDEYQKLVAALKARYQGKYVSVIGDSISTFGDYSNNTDYNSTIGGNEAFYPATLSKLASWEHTYWGRLITDLDMRLCVNNSRSGKTVYGIPDLNYADSAMFRATELDNDNGTPNDPSDDIAPDVILFYMGINDTRVQSPFGDLYEQLRNVPESDHNAIVKNWFDGVLAKTNNGSNIAQGTTITSVEQAYAMSVYKMQQKYPNAEIFCLNLIRNQFRAPQLAEKYNTCIRAIANYFGATLVDQTVMTEITLNTNHAYTIDGGVHPNAKGFYLMAKTIMETMYKKHN